MASQHPRSISDHLPIYFLYLPLQSTSQCDWLCRRVHSSVLTQFHTVSPSLTSLNASHTHTHTLSGFREMPSQHWWTFIPSFATCGSLCDWPRHFGFAQHLSPCPTSHTPMHS